MEALLPVLRPDELTLLIDHLPDGHPAADLRSGEGAHPGRRPDQDRPRVPRGVVVGGGRRRRRPDRPRAARRIGLPRTRRGARGRPRRRAPVVDAEPAGQRRDGRRPRHPRRAVGPRPAEQRRRDLRDAARARRSPAAMPRWSHRAPAPRTASSSSWRSRHPGGDAGAGRGAQGRCRRCAQGPAARRRRAARREPRGDHRDRPDRQPRHRVRTASGWRPSAATSSTRWR